jgi:hypothetical protein
LTRPLATAAERPNSAPQDPALSTFPDGSTGPFSTFARNHCRRSCRRSHRPAHRLACTSRRPSRRLLEYRRRSTCLPAARTRALHRTGALRFPHTAPPPWTQTRSRPTRTRRQFPPQQIYGASARFLAI